MPLTKDSVVKQKHKVCLKYHLGTCCGICENKVSKEISDGTREYADNVLERVENVLREAMDIVHNNRRELK